MVPGGADARRIPENGAVARPSVQWNGARVGALIGAVGGVLFVVLNAWPLGEPWTNVAIGIGVAWFLWDLRAIMRVPEDPDAVRPDARQMQAFWIVVALEVILIIGGTQLAIRVLEIPSASLPWVATVLGVHWLVFRMVFRQEVFLWLGCFTLTCGVVGLMVALTGVAGSDAPGGHGDRQRPHRRGGHARGGGYRRRTAPGVDHHAPSQAAASRA